MSIPLPFSLGNRSEYLAIPALAKLGFTVPVPRQEDHFGVDFIVHLASLEDQTVHPTGKSFGIQIKSNEEPLTFDKQHSIACLYGSVLPFFLGIVSRKNLTLTVYNTINRLLCYWFCGPERKIRIVFGGKHAGPPQKDTDGYWLAYTGKPILEVNLAEPEKPDERSAEIEKLHSTMASWINLENQNLSLKEQQVPLFYWPTQYETNKPLSYSLEHTSNSRFASMSSFPNICEATKRVLTVFSFYLSKLPEEAPNSTIKDLMKSSLEHVQSLEGNCDALLRNMSLSS